MSSPTDTDDGKNDSELSQEERIQQIRRGFWLGYEGAVAIMDRMEELLNYPKRNRMPNLAIIGESNSGKSELLGRFRNKVSPLDDPEASKSVLPVLMIQTPTGPDEAALYNEMLRALFSGTPPREPTDLKQSRLRSLLIDVEIKMIILDEFNNALAGSVVRLRKFLNAIKFLGNDLKIPIVVAGTLDALNVLSADPQFANRFPAKHLSRWSYGTEFRRLLMSFEKKLGLKQPSNLHEPDIARAVLDVSEGLIGEIYDVLRLLAERAISDGTEQIRKDDLSRARLRELGWIHPADRGKFQY